MANKRLIEQWQYEERQPFTGWDFSYLDGRMAEGQTPWSYSSQSIERLQQSASVLDMGTGGGERFLKLKDYWSPKVVATEEFPPNFKLATERLTPYGGQVIHVRLTETDPMPFDNGEFDLVLNRHSAFNPQEIARILAEGGTFLTQQVHGLWLNDLMTLFDTQPQWPQTTAERYVPLLKTAGLRIINVENWAGKIKFADVEAIVYYLKAVPWLVPNFSVDRYFEQLMKLHRRLENGEELAFSARKYLIEASK